MEIYGCLKSFLLLITVIIFLYSLEGTIISEESLGALQSDYEHLQKKYKNAKRVVLVCAKIIFQIFLGENGFVLLCINYRN